MNRVFKGVFGGLGMLVLLFFFIMGFDFTSGENEIGQNIKSEEKKQEQVINSNAEEDKSIPKGKVIELERIIGSSYTKYNSKEARKNNIKLAAEAINGLCLKEYEEFSFNDVVGERTKERGYMSAPTFLKDDDGNVQTVDDYGGGVCQVSSTLNMAVKKADLEVTKRYRHSKKVSYCKPEDEAMVSYGTADYRFRNTSDRKIRIDMEIVEGDGNEKILKCSIYAIIEIEV